eukprot:5862529-Amphidinium_carterae.1
MVVFVVSTDPTRTHSGLLNPSDEFGIPRELLPPWRMNLIPDDERKAREDNWRGVFFNKGPQGKAFWGELREMDMGAVQPNDLPQELDIPNASPSDRLELLPYGALSGRPTWPAW